MGKLFNKLTDGVKNHKEWWTDYLTEISILVISLAATFYGEHLISDYMDAQDDKETLAIVIDELNENIKELKDMEAYYDKNIRFTSTLKQYFSTNDSIPLDTLVAYCSYHQASYTPFLNDNALKMVNNSGIMRRMESKQLMKQIFDCYSLIDLIKNTDAVFEQKLSEQIYDFISEMDEKESINTVTDQWDQIKKNKKFSQFLFYPYTEMSRSRRYNCQFGISTLEKTVKEMEMNYKKIP